MTLKDLTIGGRVRLVREPKGFAGFDGVTGIVRSLPSRSEGLVTVFCAPQEPFSDRYPQGLTLALSVEDLEPVT